MKKGEIKIDRELCKGCGYCVDVCPNGSITIETVFNKKGFYPASVKDSGKCTGCALCAEICPEIAIEVWKED